MIIGIGTDLVEIARIKKASGKRFCARVYSQAELSSFEGGEVRTHERMAGSFAVKEAVAKALGVGFGKLLPTEIETLHNELGKPYVNLYGNAKRLADELGVKSLLVSISHSGEYAVAFVVAEG